MDRFALFLWKLCVLHGVLTIPFWSFRLCNSWPSVDVSWTCPYTVLDEISKSSIELRIIHTAQILTEDVTICNGGRWLVADYKYCELHEGLQIWRTSIWLWVFGACWHWNISSHCRKSTARATTTSTWTPSSETTGPSMASSGVF
jgi:hypothetical protein